MRDKDEQIENISALCTKYDTKRIKRKLVQKLQNALRSLDEGTME